jgi:ribonuclease BN (tRNA processing enzyme)
MKITVLGCSGGIGSGRHTTSLLVDHDVLIDVGSGITTMTLEQLELIDHIFITHSHLDHVLGLPLLLDAVGSTRSTPVTVYALPEVLNILAEHIFNWKIWPDFRVIPDENAPWLKFEPLPFGASVTLGERRFSPTPANHVVPACGVHVATAGGSLVFTGDTTHSASLVHALNGIPDLTHLIVETSFENASKDIALASKHHWPDSLAAELSQLVSKPQVWITHLKPGEETPIMQELKAVAAAWNLRALRQGQVIEMANASVRL